MAAQPWRDPAVARADLDAFADAAAAFADDEEEPTLGAFLAYLTAAEAEEFGLESGQPSGANAVTLTTVHAAKGLQWAAVVVPGLAAGARASVFPAKPRVTTRWTENPRLLPFGLRGDAEDLPGAARTWRRTSRDEFTGACSARELAEERRLAYVAVTRAAYWVACCRLLVGRGRVAAGPLAVPGGGPRRVRGRPGHRRALGAAAGGRRAEPGAGRARGRVVAAGCGGPRHAAVREAAALVERELARWRRPDARRRRTSGAGGGAGRGGPGAGPRLVPGRRPAADRAFRAARRYRRRRYRFRRSCRCRRWSRWQPTRTGWPSRSAGRCPAHRCRRPAGAPRSTAGWSSGSGSSG